MECPVCRADVEPLDIVSRNEHITLCLENGPSVVECEAGQLVIKKNIPLDKQRKICPICSKTYQSIFVHFRSCALKNDLTPDLMQVHWFQLNDEFKTAKVFPRDLLEQYIAKSIREGRVGEQVEFARELLQTLPESTTRNSRRANNSGASAASTIVVDESSSSMSALPNGEPQNQQQQQQQPQQPNAHQILMQNATTGRGPQATSRQATKAKTRLELANKADKKAAVDLRVERELAAPRLRRYHQAMREAALAQAAATAVAQSDECVILTQQEAADNDEDDARTRRLQTQLAVASAEAAARSGQDETSVDLSRYFFRARLKDCTQRDACLRAECTGHEVHLGLEEFWAYYGKSLLEPTRHKPPPEEDCTEDLEQVEPAGAVSPRASTSKENLAPPPPPSQALIVNLDSQGQEELGEKVSVKEQEGAQAAARDLPESEATNSPRRDEVTITRQQQGEHTKEAACCDTTSQLKIDEQSEPRRAGATA